LVDLPTKPCMVCTNANTTASHGCRRCESNHYRTLLIKVVIRCISGVDPLLIKVMSGPQSVAGSYPLQTTHYRLSAVGCRIRTTQGYPACPGPSPRCLN
jgi:ribosomal protein L40E